MLKHACLRVTIEKNSINVLTSSLFCKLAIEHTKKTYIYYYRMNDDSKGLVDAMSGFGLKTPLRKAIIIFYFLHLRVLHKKFMSLFQRK